MSRIKVMKFGGTSVATPENRLKAAMKVVSAREQGFRPVVVVSAIGRRGAPPASENIMTSPVNKLNSFMAFLSMDPDVRGAAPNGNRLTSSLKCTTSPSLGRPPACCPCRQNGRSLRKLAYPADPCSPDRCFQAIFGLSPASSGLLPLCFYKLSRRPGRSYFPMDTP